MKPHWRLVDTGHLTGAENMALNEIMLQGRSQDLLPDTLRFLQFKPHCALVGYFQTVDQEIHLAYCEQHQIDINRRITGGGAIYFDESTIGWEIYARKDNPLFYGSVEDLHARLCEGVVRGLGYLGVKARYRPRNDIEVEGRKISGTGGTELGDAFMFQGTLLVDFDADRMLRILKIPVEKLRGKEIASVRNRVVCLRELLGTVPDHQVLKEALARGLAETLGIRLTKAGLTDWEQGTLSRRLPYFSSPAWIHRIRKPGVCRKTVSSLYKTGGGLIRCSLVMDLPGNRIKSALITGDFFAYPGRIIMDLENALKDSRAEPETLSGIVEECFRKGQAQTPGLTAQDFSRAIMMAVEKAYEERNL